MRLDIVVDTIRQRIPGCLAIYLFGSHATGTDNPQSDVDVAVLPTARLAERERWDLAQTLAVALGRDVDLVDLLNASTVMRVQVIDSGKLIFELDATRRAEFEARALSDYARLNEERRAILDDIRARGSVYG